MEKLASDSVNTVVGGKDCDIGYDWDNSSGKWICSGYRYCKNKHGKMTDVSSYPGVFPASYCGPVPVKPPYQSGLLK